MSIAEAAIYTGVPATIFVGMVIAFRSQVRAFLQNTSEITTPGGFGVKAAPRAQVATDVEADALPVPREPPTDADRTNAILPPVAPLVLQVEDGLRSDLEARNPGDVSAQLATATRVLSITRIFLAHEANYRVIFSTQIMLLRSLNDQSIQRTDQAMFWYEIFHQRLPDASFTFDEWLQFLLQSGYMTIGDRVPGMPSSLSITPLGRDFLVWMVQNGIGDYRPG